MFFWDLSICCWSLQRSSTRFRSTCHMLLITEDQAMNLHHLTVSPKCTVQFLIDLSFWHGTQYVLSWPSASWKEGMTLTSTRLCSSTMSWQTSNKQNSTIEQQYWRVHCAFREDVRVLMECTSANKSGDNSPSIHVWIIAMLMLTDI